MEGETRLSGEDDLCDDWDENEVREAELRAILRQVSGFNFNNFIHSRRFQASMEGTELDRNGGSERGSDLVVLSVVLNKKQKESDEVALAIDRLRKNGVNCVFFTINDIRNPKGEKEQESFGRLPGGTQTPAQAPVQESGQASAQLPSTLWERRSKGTREDSDEGIEVDDLPKCPPLSPQKETEKHVGLTPDLPPKTARRRRRRRRNYGLRTRSKNKEGLAKPTDGVSKTGVAAPTDPPPRRARKSKEERMEEAVRDSVAICGATPEVVLRQKRKCTNKEPPSLYLPLKQMRVVRLTQSIPPCPVVRPILNGSQLKPRPRKEVTQKKKVPAKSQECPAPVTQPPSPSLPPPPAQPSEAQPPPEPSPSEEPPSLQSLPPPKMRTESIGLAKRGRAHSLGGPPQPRRSLSPDILVSPVKGKPRSLSPDITSSIAKPSVLFGKKGIRRSLSLQDPELATLSPLDCLEKETKSTLDRILKAVVSLEDKQTPLRQLIPDSEDIKDAQVNSIKGLDEKREESETSVKEVRNFGSEDSLPDFLESMQLRRSSFYSLVTGNVRTNLENYLDGRGPLSTKSPKRRRRVKNGFLLHHGDNCPEDPESPYKLHLATQVLLKLSKRRSKAKPKDDRGKTLLSYLKLVPKRALRAGKTPPKTDDGKEEAAEVPLFSGEWTVERKYVCGVCGATEGSFWDMVTHKGEEHPGVVVTHIELPSNQLPPSSLVRDSADSASSLPPSPPPCTKCHLSFATFSDLHSHIFECAGNASWLEEKVVKKPKGRRKRGFKRRFSSTPKKNKKPESPKRRTSDPYKCEFCVREFKTEGWLRNHRSTHSLPVSIPLDKLPLASLPVRACLRKLKY